MQQITGRNARDWDEVVAMSEVTALEPWRSLMSKPVRWPRLHLGQWRAAAPPTRISVRSSGSMKTRGKYPEERPISKRSSMVKVTERITAKHAVQQGGKMSVRGHLSQKDFTKVKGKVYKTIVRPAMMYGLETAALRKRREQNIFTGSDQNELIINKYKLLSI